MTPPDRIVAPRRLRLRTGLGAVVVLGLVGLAIAVLVTALGGRGSTETVGSAGPAAGGQQVDGADNGAANGAELGGPTGAIIFVHLLGAVARPGLYELREGDRAVDAVAAAGGFTDQADQTQLNLARLLADGEQIYVPVVGEVQAAPEAAGAVGGKVNLNTADEAALDTLPGVGPATAQRILDWREANGRFTTIEDLLSVSGIGDKTFVELKDLVTV